MSFDLLIKGGHLPDGAVRDIGIKGDRIAAVDAKLPEEAGKVIDARGQLVSPPFAIRIFIWMQRSLMESRALINQEPCLKA